MSRNTYSEAIIKDLHRLAQLAKTRRIEARLKAVTDVISQWKKKTISEEIALQKIVVLTSIKEEEWAEGADPGIPIAQALAEGTLSRKDINNKSWKAVEVLVDLVKV